MTGPPLNCQETVELTTDYLERALLPGLEAQLDQHLDTCPACTTYLAQIRQTIQTLRDLIDEAMPYVSRQELLQAFRVWRQNQRGKSIPSSGLNGR